MSDAPQQFLATVTMLPDATGRCKVTVDGAATQTPAWPGPYTPSVNDRVVVIRVGKQLYITGSQDVYDSGTVTTLASITAAAGTSITGVLLHRVGKVCQAVVVGTYPAITVGATGNITNTNLGTIADPQFRPQNAAPLAAYSTGDIAAFTVQTTGVLQVTAFPPGHASVTSGTAYSCGGTYLVN